MENPNTPDAGTTPQPEEKIPITPEQTPASSGTEGVPGKPENTAADETPLSPANPADPSGAGEPVVKFEISATEEQPSLPVVKEHYASDSYSADVFGGVRFDTTADIEIPKSLIDQVIGQEHAVDVIKKAATQRRHVMMIGSPGTGKSMLAKAMSELLPKEEMQDILVYPNPEDNNNPIIRVVNAGRGKEIVARHKEDPKRQASSF